MLKVYKQSALIALPRTGSTWFADCLFGDLKGCPNWEFFNPAINNQFYAIIGGNRYWWRILLPLLEEEENLIKTEWDRSGLQAVKECWGCAKLDFFQKHFHCCTLVRKTEHTFPGLSSVKVTDFSYRAYYAALMYHKIQFPKYRLAINFLYSYANSLHEKLAGSHLIMNTILTRECKERQIPVYEYEKLMTLDAQKLSKYLQMPNNHRVVDRIISTRVPRLSTEHFDKLGIGRFIEDLRSELH